MYQDIILQLQSVSYFGNSGYDWVIAAIIFIALLIILKIFQVIILARLHSFAKKTKTDYDDLFIAVFRGLRPPFYLLIALWFAIQYLSLNDLTVKIINILFIIVIVYEVIRALEKVLNFFLEKYSQQADGQAKNAAQVETLIRTIQFLIRPLLWLIGLIVVLGNLGIDVTALVASLGIGGIAIALALQNVLGDLFSALSIYIDKPFEVGDFIVAGDESGTVEKIGLKTTRIRSLQGEQIIVSNSDLISARVQNFKRLKKRRVVLSVGATYDTPPPKLKKIPEIVKAVIDNVDIAEFDRCHFNELADSSLNYEIVYYVNHDDFTVNMDVRQQVLLGLVESFNKEKIEFAFPTQTLYIQK